MTTNKEEPIYRVIFFQNGQQYEIYSRYLSEDSLMGFIELEELVFSTSNNSIVVDPSEEKLKIEFKDVKRSYIPMHAILRIDEVQNEGVACIRDIPENKNSNVSQFPKILFQSSIEKE